MATMPVFDAAQFEKEVTREQFDQTALDTRAVSYDAKAKTLIHDVSREQREDKGLAEGGIAQSHLLHRLDHIGR
jgi:hypothetical protein